MQLVPGIVLYAEFWLGDVGFAVVFSIVVLVLGIVACLLRVDVAVLMRVFDSGDHALDLLVALGEFVLPIPDEVGDIVD